MPFGDASKILKSNQYQKSDKAPYVLYASLESLIRRTDRYKTYLENHPQEKQVNIFPKVIQCLRYGCLMV